MKASTIKKINNNDFIYKHKIAFFLLSEQQLKLYEAGFKKGFELAATSGTAEAFVKSGLVVKRINKVLEGRPHIVDAMKNKEIDLVINTTENAQAIEDSFELRRTALTRQIPYYTTMAGAIAAVQAISALKTKPLEVAPLQSYSMVPYLDKS